MDKKPRLRLSDNFPSIITILCPFAEYNYAGWDGNYSTYENYRDIFHEFFGVDTQPVAEAREVLLTYMCPILLAVAIVGNVASCIIMYRLGCRVLSTCAYLSLLALLDLFLVLAEGGDAWLQQLMEYSPTKDLMNHSDVFCRSYTFIKSFVRHLAGWLLVTASIEGVWLSSEPRKCAHLLTKFRARTTILLLTLVSSLLNVHFFWTFMMMEFKEHGQVLTHCAFVKFGIAYNKSFQVAIWPLMDLMLGDILPLAIVSICTIMAASKILCRSESPPEGTTTKSYFIWGSQVIRQLRILICLLGLFFVALKLPLLAWKLKKDYTYNKLFPGETPKYSQADISNQDEYSSNLEFTEGLNKVRRDQLIGTSVTIIWYVFLSCKVFLYLATSQKFRSELVHLLCCRNCKETCDHSKDRVKGRGESDIEEDAGFLASETRKSHQPQAKPT